MSEPIKDVVTTDQTQAPTVQSESATVLSLISHAASDPNVDMDKMERLMTMRQKMVDDEAGAFERSPFVFGYERAWGLSVCGMLRKVPLFVGPRAECGFSREGIGFC